MNKKIVLSGTRPTGNIHLGNYFGAIANWVELQKDYDCYFFIADYHALTTGYDQTEQLQEHCKSLMVDFLSCGLNPAESTLFLQSLVPEHSELFLLLSMNLPLSWLLRCPTYKDKMNNQEDKESATYGFLGYPALQAADILIYQADFVPVGEDQLPHIEITREIARRFKSLYHSECLKEPAALLTKSKVLPGIDGRKMSKSYHNTIALAETPDQVQKKVMKMLTDPARLRKDDLGHPEVCTVFSFQKVFNPDSVASIEDACRKGEIGCVACKKLLQEKISQFHTPIYQRRQEWLQRPDDLVDIIKQGSAKARIKAQATLAQVKQSIHIGLD